jgi:hypothetical protein
MWEKQPGDQEFQARIIGVVLVSYVVLSLMTHDWGLLMEVLGFAAALVLAGGLLVGGLWLLIKFFTLGAGAGDARKPILGISPCRFTGWAMFGACGLLCAFTGHMIYWWTIHLDIFRSLCWLSSLLFGLPYVLAGLGFVTAVSDRPFDEVPWEWAALGMWRRLVLVAFVTAAAAGLVLCHYYLYSLITTSRMLSPDLAVRNLLKHYDGVPV